MSTPHPCGLLKSYGILLDTADSLYASPVNPGERFGLRFEFDPVQQATLVVPTR